MLYVLELCAGMGGMALGFRQAGFCSAALIEKDDRCVRTLRLNGWDNIIHSDVRDVDFSTYVGVDVVSGGVPCQAFSPAGKKLGASDERNLWPFAMEAVRVCAPRGFMFENSAGMASKIHAEYLEYIVSEFVAMGYNVRKHVVDAAQYGCAQHRRRLILVGTLSGVCETPETKPVITLREAIHDLGEPNGLNGHCSPTSHARSYKGHTPSSLDGPSKTVVAGVNGNPGGANAVCMDDGSLRYMTCRELARLQTFPDEYILPEVRTTAIRQLGNAAPPALIKAFAERLFESISNEAKPHGDNTESINAHL